MIHDHALVSVDHRPLFIYPRHATMSFATGFVALIALASTCAGAPLAADVHPPQGAVDAPAANPTGVWKGTLGVVPHQSGQSGASCTTCGTVVSNAFGELGGGARIVKRPRLSLSIRPTASV